MAMDMVSWMPPHRITGGFGVPYVIHGGADSISVIERGCTGLDMPPVSVEAVEAAGVAGEVRIGRKVQARDITIPLRIHTRQAHPALDSDIAQVVHAFGVDDEVGQLRIHSAGTERTLQCSYVGGLEGDEAFERVGLDWWKATVRLRAHDPFWQDAGMFEVTFREDAQVPFFPLRLGNDAIRLNADATFGSYYAPSIGDVPSYPEWWIEGPFDGFDLSNSAGETFRYGRAYPAGGGVGVNFDPLNAGVTVRVPAGGDHEHLRFNVWDGTVWPSELWSIRPGAQSVMVALSGSTNASYARLRWRRRWLSWRSAD